MHPYKQSGRCQDVQDDQARPTIDQTSYMDAWKKYNKTACTKYKASWGWTLGCSKHVEDTIIELKH